MLIRRIIGTPVNINKIIVGRVTRNAESIEENSILLIEQLIPEIIPNNITCILSTHIENMFLSKNNLVYNISSLNHLSEGDIVSVGNDGNINTLYRVNSFQNTLLATERCNSNCLMCSQPPKDNDDIKFHYEVHKKLIPLIPKDCIELGISGGEPTLMGDDFFNLLSLIKTELPNTEIHVLTNGRTFAWNNMAEKLSKLDYKRLMLGIPVYSDYYQIHDYIVQAENAFNQTILGLHNLARYNQRLEVRVVLHKQSIPRLNRLAKYIYKNLPFVEHVTFMGLEFIGYTPHNIEKLWIDPFDYQDELTDAVEYLAGQGIRVSIYNTPLCVLPERLWQYSKKSISDWKNDYLPECNDCSKLTSCSGLFTWNLKKHSEHIKPFPPLAHVK